MRSRVQVISERLLAYAIVISPPIAAALTAVLLVRHRGRFGRVLRERETLGVFALVGALGIISTLLAEWPQAAFQGPAGLLTLFIAWLVGWMAVEDPAHFWRDLQRGIGIVALLAAAWILKPFQLQFTLGGFTVPIVAPHDPVSIFGLGANGLGPLLVFGAVLALGRMYQRGNPLDRVEAAAIAAIALVVGLVIGVRSTVLGTLAGALTLMLSTGPAGAVLVMLVVLTTAATINLHAGMWTSLIDFTTEAQRSKLWSSALRMTGDHPWFGVGPFHFVLANARYMAGDPDLPLGLGAHNIYLRMLAEWGIPAAVPLFAWLFSRPVRLWKRRSEIWRWSFVAGFVAFLVMGIFDDPLFTMHVSTPIFAGIGLAASDLAPSPAA
ncbi:MAG: O-antigen ligase family protein [bacterium]